MIAALTELEVITLFVENVKINLLVISEAVESIAPAPVAAAGSGSRAVFTDPGGNVWEIAPPTEVP